MSSLRDLLDFAGPEDVPPATAFGQPGTMFTFRGIACAGGQAVNNYESQQLCWCVPPLDAKKLRVEIWGGGGMGGAPYCTSTGVPGYSGEYNSRILCADELSITNFNGQCYVMCVGMANCCAVCHGGCMGCKTYVQGPGLSGFCAEGGYGGKYQGICYGFNNGRYGCNTAIGNNCCGNCGCTPAYCCWHETENAPFDRTERAAKEALGICYNGITASYLVSDCCCRTIGGKKTYTPLPGGLMGRFGGYMVNGFMCNDCYLPPDHWRCVDCDRANSSGGIFPGLGSATCGWGGPPGMGGGQGYLGCCYYCSCGGIGASGAVRFTLYPSTEGA